MISSLIRQSEGVTGRVTWLLGRAAEIAIAEGSEHIDVAGIERISDRLRIAAA